MEKALQKVSEFFNKYATQFYLKAFERIQGMTGANRIFKRIGHAPDKDQVEDYLTEVQYALIFESLGFQVEIESFRRLFLVVDGCVFQVLCVGLCGTVSSAT